MKGKFIGLDKKVWIGLLVLGVIVYLYVRHKSATSSSVAPSTSGVDESQLASDITGQLSAALGGTQPATDSGASSAADMSQFLQELAQQEAQFMSQFEGSLSGLTAAGVAPAWFNQPPAWWTSPTTPEATPTGYSPGPAVGPTVTTTHPFSPASLASASVQRQTNYLNAIRAFNVGHPL